MDGPTRRWLGFAAVAAVGMTAMASVLSGCGSNSAGVDADNSRPNKLADNNLADNNLADDAGTGIETEPGTGSSDAADSNASADGTDQSGVALDDDDQVLVDAIAASIDNTSPVALSTTEARCWAGAMVADVGAERLNELGINTDSISGIDTLSELGLKPADATAITDSLFVCTDAKALVRDQLASSVDNDVTDCVLDNVDDDSMRALVSASILGDVADPDVLSKFAAAGSSCLTD